MTAIPTEAGPAGPAEETSGGSPARELTSHNDIGIATAARVLNEGLARLINREHALGLGEVVEVLNDDDDPVDLPFLNYLGDRFDLDQFERLVLLTLIIAELDTQFNEQARAYLKLERGGRVTSVALLLNLYPEGGAGSFSRSVAAPAIGVDHDQ